MKSKTKHEKSLTKRKPRKEREEIRPKLYKKIQKNKQMSK